MIIIFFKIIGISWLIYHYDDFVGYINEVIKNWKKIILIPKWIMGCLKCTTFWTSLIMTGGNIWLSSCISIIGYAIEKYIIDDGFNVN